MSTQPCMLIEGTYVVPPGSKLDSVDALGRSGICIRVATSSAYGLF